MKIEYSRKSAKLVLVATPEVPLIDTWRPRSVDELQVQVDRVAVAAEPGPTLRSIWSKYSAFARSSPVAR